MRMDENRNEMMVEKLSDSSIERRIYTVRGEYVMIDRDLADLYGVENRSLRQSVRRNMEKFPDDFLFKLTKDEANSVITSGVSQSVIPPGYNTGGMQMFAFTEQGVAMLSTSVRLEWWPRYIPDTMSRRNWTLRSITASMNRLHLCSCRMRFMTVT